jgi:hypothetical protein
MIMKKYLIGALLSTFSFGAFAACQGTDQPLIIASENICGAISAPSTKGEIAIRMPAGPGSELYLLHQNKLNKLSPGIFKNYVDSLKKDEIPSGVSHAIRAIKFAPTSLPQYANKTFSCATPHIIEAPKGNIDKAVLLIPNCVAAVQ